MKLYVILLNWNGWKDTIACMQSLLASSYQELRIVVCDNGSRDDSLIRLEQWAQETVPGQWSSVVHGCTLSAQAVAELPRVIIMDNQANLGFAAGCNTGMALALQDPECQYLWLLNNDTEVAPTAIERVLHYMDQHTDIGICGSTLIYHHDRHMVQAYGGSAYCRWLGKSRHLGAFSDARHLPTAKDVPAIEAETTYVVGAAMMLRRQLLERTGLLYEGYFLYYEELDLACRAAPFGRIGYAHDSVVYHKEGASIGTHASGGSPLSLYYLFRNRLRFTWRFYPACLPTVFLYALWELCKLILKRRWPQAWATFRGLAWLPAPVVRR